MLRYKKLQEAAKDVDDFTRFVVEKYAELHHHLHLNHDYAADDDDDDDDDDGVEPAQRQSFRDPDISSKPEPTLIDPQHHQPDNLNCNAGRGNSSSYQRLPSTEGWSMVNLVILIISIITSRTLGPCANRLLFSVYSFVISVRFHTR